MSIFKFSVYSNYIVCNTLIDKFFHMLKRSVSISNTPGCRFPHESHHLVSHCICLFQSRCLRWYIQASLVAYSLACTVHYAHFPVTAELKSVNAGCETLCRGRHCAKGGICVRCAGAGR